ncbi:MAG: helix-hairpin-helix domain-containing protein [Woeseia sp.]
MKRSKMCLSMFVCLLAGPLLALAGPVDVNTADAATISAELNGVGLVKAQAIVEYRSTHGPFKSPDDLVLVKGIGARTIDMNRENIHVQPPKNPSGD